MAVPKKKISTSRRGKRRSHDALKNVNILECTNCGEPKLAHQICLYCNYYDNKEIVETVQKDEETKEN